MLLACQEKIDVSNTEGYEPFITQLKEGLKNTSHETAANHKVAKVSLAAINKQNIFIVTSNSKVCVFGWGGHIQSDSHW